MAEIRLHRRPAVRHRASTVGASGIEDRNVRQALLTLDDQTKLAPKGGETRFQDSAGIEPPRIAGQGLPGHLEGFRFPIFRRRADDDFRNTAAGYLVGGDKDGRL